MRGFIVRTSVCLHYARLGFWRNGCALLYRKHNRETQCLGHELPLSKHQIPDWKSESGAGQYVDNYCKAIRAANLLRSNLFSTTYFPAIVCQARTGLSRQFAMPFPDLGG